VASVVSFKNGRPDRSNYRRFRMKTVTGQNDFACMAETVHRRYGRLLHEQREAEAAATGDSQSSEPMLLHEASPMFGVPASAGKTNQSDETGKIASTDRL